MSGICGIAFPERTHRQHFQCLTPMLREIDRSAQSQGHMHIEESIGFGVQAFPGRLSGIAELVEHGKTHCLGFHGSVYNLDEVLAPVREHHDPLVAMLALSLRGIQSLLTRLRGDFVLSFWDANQEALFLATDRFRVHPLFFRQDHDKFVFSSRMQGLLACPSGQDMTINPSAVLNVISSSFIPTPRTIFREVQKLPPGQLLTWKKGAMQLEPYWDMNFPNSGTLSRTAYSEKLKETFSDSITVRMKYDQKADQIGSFLSGGIDSSTVLGVLTQLAQTRMNSFSIGFGEEAFNEMSFARCAANAFDSQQHEYVVTADDTFQIIDLLVENFDEPYANASAIPTYFCAKLAREHGFQVLYGGDGGDELFAGNERYATQKIFDYYKAIPRWLRNYGVSPAVSMLASLLKLNVCIKGKKYIQRANTPYPDRLFSWGLFEILCMEEVFSGDFLKSLGDRHDPYDHVRELYAHSQSLAHTELERQLYLDMKLVISDNDILKVTRMTEANGIAVRFPFLDHRLAEFAAGVPAHIKMEGTQLRTFFKSTYSNLLPEEIRTKTKHGFGLPIPIWLRTHKKLREMMMDLLRSERVHQRGYFGQHTIDDLLKRHQEDTTSFFGTILWNFFMLELWLRRYSDKH
ncbi:asparagine synthetase B family protein [Candidatus Nitrospira salsa]